MPSAPKRNRAAYSPVVIETVRPAVNCGRFRAKAIAGDRVR
ncbi:MAG: DUF3416 domain-containing protein, partial [Actinobacteria bacterium]|nr:DUF3416 domain-containing protein [Actinomycetota bacterium]